MNQTRLAASTVVLLFTSLALFGCGGGVCSIQNPCSADPSVSPATCENAIYETPRCARQTEVFFACWQKNRVCAADRTTDLTATYAKCPAEASDWYKCRQAVADSK